MKSLIIMSALLSSTAFAGDIAITNAKIFTPIQGTNTTAAYGTIKNTSKKSITVKIVEAQPFTAVELHETVQKDGRMAMQKMEQIQIEAGKEFELKPGGNHIMLFDAKSPVVDDQKITVKFSVNGKDEKVEFPVVSRIPKSEKEEHHHH